MKRLGYLLMIPFLFFGCNKNHPPVIADLTCTPETRNAGTLFTLTAAASDEDGNFLNYTWSADEGSFPVITNIRTIKWKSPVNGAGKTYTVTVVVSDGKSEVSHDIQILLTEPERGTVAGHVYYTHFNIPVPEAIITVGDAQATTDALGYFELSLVPAGECVFTATKQDFSLCTQTIEVPVNRSLVITAEITSVNHTTKLSGIITDQEGEPLEYARIVVLNPDGSESALVSTTTATGFYSLLYIPHGERTLVVNKEPSDNYGYVTLTKTIDFHEVESQLNLSLQKLPLTGDFTDTRDNHVYRYRTIGDLTWMAENLAYLPRVTSPGKGSYLESFFYVYDYQGTNKEEAMATENCRLYGVLYNWPAAMSICPKGWHLPSQIEWNTLINKYGSNIAGKKLKTTSGWYDRGNGDNTSGFSALPAGMLSQPDSTFHLKLESAGFWSSSYIVYPAACVATFTLYYGNDYVIQSRTRENDGLSVRCVRDN